MGGGCGLSPSRAKGACVGSACRLARLCPAPWVAEPLPEPQRQIKMGTRKNSARAFRLCLADRPPATQDFRGSSLVSQNWPDVLVLQPAFFHKRIQRFVG